MKRAAITQRVELIGAYGEFRDCLDQRWIKFLEQLNLLPLPIPNVLRDPIQWMEDQKIDCVFLTGGNDLPDCKDASKYVGDRDRTELAILTWAREKRIPLVGVCRGMQMMNVFLGGSTSPVSHHIAKRHKITFIGQTVGEVGEDSKMVNSFHNWGLITQDLAPDLEACALSDDSTVELARHKNLPWIAMMWHPERETPFDQQDNVLINNLLTKTVKR